MCDLCLNTSIDVEEELAAYREKVEAVVELQTVIPQLPEEDREFAGSLLHQFLQSHSLSGRQWPWVFRLRDRVRGAQPLLGNFRAIHVMFRIAGTSGLQKPKVRLMSKAGTFVQLNFDPDRPEAVKVFRDGWAGHGQRRYAGSIIGDSIIPYDLERMTPDVVEVIQQLALDPIGTAKAMAALLGCCLYCGQRLADPESKERGYGATCAKTWNQPWGNRENAPLTQMELDALEQFDEIFGG